MPAQHRCLSPLLQFVSMCLLVVSAQAWSQKQSANQTDFDQYTVHHVIFNSTFILPEVAKAYNIKRSKYESLINVSVNKKGQFNGQKASLSGTVTNLMQQQKQLKFIEIREANATYYLAPIRVGSEEVVHIKLSVTPQGQPKPFDVTFSQKIYPD